MKQDEFVDPDHKVEYTYGELAELITGTGFEVVDAKGLNYAGASLAAGQFDIEEVAGNAGMYAEVEDCYILCVVARKPEQH